MRLEAYTPEEVASLFKISKHTVYELVKRGELQAFKIGNKMRIDQEEINRFKEKGRSTTATTVTPIHSLSITGSHDLLIEALIKYISVQAPFLSLQPSFIGSLEGLMNLYRGSSDIAAVHLLDPISKQYNLPFIRQLFVQEPITVIRLAGRAQGLMIQKGNPKGIHAINDLSRKDVTFTNRQKGSGTRFLLDSLLAEENIPPSAIRGYEETEWTHVNAAIKVQQGYTDAAVGIRSVANMLGLDFVPIATEQFDLVLRWTEQNKDALLHLLDLLQYTSFKESVSGMEGYELSDFGKVIYDTTGRPL